MTSVQGTCSSFFLSIFFRFCDADITDRRPKFSFVTSRVQKNNKVNFCFVGNFKLKIELGVCDCVRVGLEIASLAAVVIPE